MTKTWMTERWAPVAAVSLLAAVAVALLATLFLWPVRAASPADLPLVIAGPPQATRVVEQRLSAAGAPFRTSSVADRDAAARAIRERAAYGGIVLTPGATLDAEILTASAASPAVAQSLTQLSAQLGTQLGGQVSTQPGGQLEGQPSAPSGAPGLAVRARATDVVPLAAADPRGAGIAMLALPLGIGGLLVGVLVALRVRGRTQAILALLGAAALAGLGWTVVLHPWFGMLVGSFWAEWGLATLAVAATAAFVAGAHALIGMPGVALAALITTPLGFPLAGTQLPREFLPTPWGDIGQALVPGASATAFRLESYFPEAALGAPLLVLAAWLLGGLAAVVLGTLRSRPLAR